LPTSRTTVGVLLLLGRHDPGSEDVRRPGRRLPLRQVRADALEEDPEDALKVQLRYQFELKWGPHETVGESRLSDGADDPSQTASNEPGSAPIEVTYLLGEAPQTRDDGDVERRHTEIVTSPSQRGR